MKKIFYFGLLSVFLVAGCKDKHVEKRKFTANVPMYASFATMRNAVKTESVRALKDPGKIFVYGNYLLVNERHRGIHVINNTDPSNPQFISFIAIPGNVDMEIKEGILYADSYTDLVALELSNPENVTVKHRINDVFQYTVPPYDEQYPLAKIDPSLGVIVDWKVMEVTETCVDDECNTYRFNENGMLISETSGRGFGGSNGGGANFRNLVPGQGGSTARFVIHNSCLYTVSKTDEITVFDVSNTTSPVVANRVDVNEWANLETLFKRDNQLFVGSRNGVFIYDISNTCQAEYISEFHHATSCDPVVVSGNYAYFTMRSGDRCGNFENSLNVLDITDISSPKFMSSASLNSPYGLGLDPASNTLFVCDGGSGIRLFGTTHPANIASQAKGQLTGMDAFDVIPWYGTLFVSGKNGIYQYDYTDMNNVQLKSVIPVNS